MTNDQIAGLLEDPVILRVWDRIVERFLHNISLRFRDDLREESLTILYQVLREHDPNRSSVIYHIKQIGPKRLFDGVRDRVGRPGSARHAISRTESLDDVFFLSHVRDQYDFNRVEVDDFAAWIIERFRGTRADIIRDLLTSDQSTMKEIGKRNDVSESYVSQVRKQLADFALQSPTFSKSFLCNGDSDGSSDH